MANVLQPGPGPINGDVPPSRPPIPSPGACRRPQGPPPPECRARRARTVRGPPVKHVTPHLERLGIDPYLLAILATVALAVVLPADGSAARGLSAATTVLIGLLFFLYGARLSPRAALAGATHWRLHLTILTATFALFPLLGLAARALTAPVLGPDLARGVLFLCLLPSTLQSSIAFTTIAGGNTAGAVCAASFSSLVGIVVTPLLASLLLGGAGAVRLDGERC
ncbi:hypothetical protein GCM10025734_08420 [Kitasatospora paranensis]